MVVPQVREASASDANDLYLAGSECSGMPPFTTGSSRAHLCLVSRPTSAIGFTQIVVLKRFESTLDRMVKNDSMVGFPLEGLQLAPFMADSSDRGVRSPWAVADVCVHAFHLQHA